MGNIEIWITKKKNKGFDDPDVSGMTKQKPQRGDILIAVGAAHGKRKNEEEFSDRIK